VLTVADVAKTCDFYKRLGMTVVTFAEGRTALAFGTQKINLHQVGHEFEPKALRPTPGSADLCFLTGTPLPEVVRHLDAYGIAIIEGPVRRMGAISPIESIYVRDLDGNLIEIANSL
jgi:catechol 2,3-dioxygenase-like lactoylglutathione lyase family enzyme